MEDLSHPSSALYCGILQGCHEEAVDQVGFPRIGLSKFFIKYMLESNL
jgi:hypothetical protein